MVRTGTVPARFYQEGTLMQYMLLIYSEPMNADAPDEAEMKRWFDYGDDLVSAESTSPVTLCTRSRRRRRCAIVTARR